MHTHVRCAAFAAAALAVLWPGAGAHASRGFPPQIRTYLGLSYTPACSLCHQEGKTGSGTVFTPFALSTRARGLTSGGGRTLVSSNMSTTLSRMIADNVDSDGDGVSDIDELKAGTDPNVSGPVPMATMDPTYGCSTAPATVLVPVLLAAIAFTLRRVAGARRC
jgi:uncharacterized protein (TIGR03382 family)